MTRRYVRTLSNGITAKLRVTACTGRRPLGQNLPPSSKVESHFSGPTFPEDAEKIQAEYEAFLKFAMNDAGRAAGGKINYTPNRILLYETPQTDPPAPDAATESTLDASVSVASPHVAPNGEVVAPVSTEPDPGEVVGTSEA